MLRVIFDKPVKSRQADGFVKSSPAKAAKAQKQL